MIIRKAEFVVSNTDPKKCPESSLPEFAFVGRSNVGKSSLINMLTDHKDLAKVSSTPGKTRLINHFNINDEWLLVDLPGYGYAKVGRSTRAQWTSFIREYLAIRPNLFNVFVLIDSRHEPQENDLEFMEFLGLNEVPFAMVFTKVDKLSQRQLGLKLENYKTIMLKSWEELPPIFITSSEKGGGRDELLNYIEQIVTTAE